jgi:hypothetical protein
MFRKTFLPLLAAVLVLPLAEAAALGQGGVNPILPDGYVHYGTPGMNVNMIHGFIHVGNPNVAVPQPGGYLTLGQTNGRSYTVGYGSPYQYGYASPYVGPTSGYRYTAPAYSNGGYYNRGYYNYPLGNNWAPH